MLLRSSSTPLLGTLLSSISESPNSHHQSELHGATTKHTPSPIQNCAKLTCTNGGSQNYSKSLMSSPSVAEIKPQNGFRRVRSEGNLENRTNNSYIIDEFSFSNQYQKKITRKPNRCPLEAIPSFSHHKLETSYEDNEDSDEEEFDKENEEIERIHNTFRAEELVLENMINNSKDYGSWGFESEGKMHLATGPGISGISYVDDSGGFGGGNGGGGYRPVAFDRDGGGDNSGVGMEEEHYKKMLESDPGNPLFLRNYAQFLYQTKGDLPRAEEYYSRAILTDPEDGEILSQYAKLIWELRHDKERAANYFQRAVRASSEDSHIHAAYASFLWDIADDEEEENTTDNSRFRQPLFHHGIMASASA